MASGNSDQRFGRSAPRRNSAAERLRKHCGMDSGLNQRTPLAEGLESRLMLTGLNPGGDPGLGQEVLSSPRVLAPADVSIIEINGSSTAQYDRVSLGSTLDLDGILKIKFGNGFSLGANQTFSIITRPGSTGAITGAFTAIDGLAGPVAGARNLVAIQSPTRFVLVSTTLPSFDGTLIVDDDAEVAGLISFFSAGDADGLDDSASATGSLSFFGQRLEGTFTFNEADDAGTPALGIDFADTGTADLALARLVLTGGGADAFSAYGTGSLTLNARGQGGLAVDSFDVTGFSFANATHPIGVGITTALGPISIEELFPSITTFSLDDQELSLTVTLTAAKVSLQFAGAGENPGGVKVEGENIEGSFEVLSTYDPVTLLISSSGGKFSLGAETFTLEVPDFVNGSATEVEFTYDPNGGDDQEILRLNSLNLEIPKLKAKFDIGETDADDDIPGLIVYKNGFEFTNARFTLNTSEFNQGSVDNEGFLTIGAGIRVRDPFVEFQDFVLRYSGGTVSTLSLGAIAVGAAEVRIGIAGGSLSLTGVDLTGTFALGPIGLPTGFTFEAASIEITVGPLSVSGLSVEINTSPDLTDADDTNDNYVAFESLSVTLDLGAVFGASSTPAGQEPPSSPFTATMRNFAIDANGNFIPGNGDDRFGLGLSLDIGEFTEFITGADGPSETPTDEVTGPFSAAIDLIWEDLLDAPSSFVMLVSFRFDGTLGPLSLSGSVTNLIFDSERLMAGDNPIIGVESITGSLEGNVFGAMFNATLIAGSLSLDSNGDNLTIAEIIANPSRVDRSVLYFGAKGGITLAGLGLEMLIGFSELGFIQAFVRINAPITIDPISGLTIDGLRGGITLNGPALPSITDPVLLRSSIFKPTLDLDEQEWVELLKRITLTQAGGGGGYIGTVLEENMVPLDAAADADQPIPAVVTALLTDNGFTIDTTTDADTTVTILDPAQSWLLSDAGRQFLIYYNGLTGFDFYLLGSGAFTHIQDGEITGLPDGADTTTVDQVEAVVDGMDMMEMPFEQTLVGLFHAQGIEIDPASVVSVVQDGFHWKIVTPNGEYRLRKMTSGDTGEQTYVISGGDGASLASGSTSTNIRIEVGFTLYSAYVRPEVTKFELDAIIDSTGKFVLLGKLLFGDSASSSALLEFDVKLFVDLSQLQAGTGGIYFLTDFSVPTIADPDVREVVLSIYGALTFGFYFDPANPGEDPILITPQLLMDDYGYTSISQLLDDSDPTNDPDFFELRLEGSQTAGIAEFKAGETQSFILGAPSSNTPDPGGASLRIRNDRLEFAFDVGISATGFIEATNFISAAGIFVIEFDSEGDFEAFYGVAEIAATADDITPLKLAGISANFSALIKINVGLAPRQVDLRLPGSTMATTYELPELSFGLYFATTVTFAPPIAGGLVNLQIFGAFGLEISAANGIELFILGSTPVPIPLLGAAVPILQADILGVLRLGRIEDGAPGPDGDRFGIAGRLELAIRPPTGGFQQFFDFRADLQLFFNTSGVAVTYELPEDFASRFVDDIPASLQARLDPDNDGNNNTISISIPAGAPKLGWTPGNTALEDAASPYFVFMAVGDLIIGAGTGLGSAGITVHGDFRIAFSGSEGFAFAINGTASVDPIGAVIVSGQVNIRPDATEFVEAWGSFQLAGVISIGPLNVSAGLSLDFNTSDDPQNINRYYDPATHTVSTTPMPFELPANSVALNAAGQLSWGGVVLLSGEFSFTATDTGAMISVNAVTVLQPIAGIAISGAIEVVGSGGSAEAAGYLRLQLNFDLPGFNFTGVTYFAFNTNETTRTFTNVPDLTDSMLNPNGSFAVAPNSFIFFVQGDLNLEIFGSDILSLHGKFVISNTTEKLSVLAEARLSVGAFFGVSLLSIDVSGSADIFKSGPNAGALVLDVQVNELSLGIDGIFELEFGSAANRPRLQLNTGSGAITSAAGNSIPRGFKFSTGDITLKVVGIDLLSGSAFIAYQPDAPFADANGAWCFGATLGFNFFDIVTFNGSIQLYSKGAFYFNVSGGLMLGTRNFGIEGSASVTVSYLAQNDSNDAVLSANDLYINGSFSVSAYARAKIFGHWVGVSIGLSGEITYSNSELYISACVDLGLFDVCGSFSLGRIDFNPPPPVYLAGPQATFTGGVLDLNVGNRAILRNAVVATTAESYTVEALTAPDSMGRQNVRVYAFGYVQDYINVTGIVADFTSDSDILYVGLPPAAGTHVPFALPITVSGGDGADIIILRTSGTVIVNAQGGDDYIESNGSPTSSINGGEGSDTIVWFAGAGAQSIAGGEDADGVPDSDTLLVRLTTGDDLVRIARPGGSQFAIQRLNASSVPFETLTIPVSGSFEVLSIEAERGYDEIRVDDLAGSGLSQVNIDLSQYDARLTDTDPNSSPILTNDTASGLVIVTASAGDDSVTLATPSDTGDADGDGSTSEKVLTLARPGVAIITIINAVNAQRHGLQVITLAGVDTITAAAVSSNLARLTIDSGANRDIITGSPFADTINAGDGDNQVDAGGGDDLVTTGSGNDTINGDAGNDTIDAGNGANIVHGNAGNDSITTGSGIDQLYGDADNDTLVAGSESDFLDGGDGNDHLDGGLGNDQFTGGLGTDTYADAGGDDTLVETRSSGDLLITDDTFVVGVLTAAARAGTADVFASATEVENLGFIFQFGTLTTGNDNNALIVGDYDGRILIGSIRRDVAQQFHGDLELIGQAGSDRYVITIFGTAGSLINITDSAGSADALSLYGSDTPAAGDVFLVRRNFVAALDPAGAGDGAARVFDRVNYSNALEAGMTLTALSGDDIIVTDDNAIPATIIAGAGRDYMQIGQIFGSTRETPRVARLDVFDTTEIDLSPSDMPGTISGFLSNGASLPITYRGGEGNDSFVVFRNVAAINLEGEAGDDTFSVRSFATAATNINGGSGTNFIEYVANAAVAIDGGAGYDSVRVLGTQFGDTYTLTETGISGAGLTATFTAVEALELHTGDGNDTVYVLGTITTMRIAVYGGAGSDHFFVTGNSPDLAPRPLTLERITGPILFEGGPGDVGVFGLPEALLLPGETDTELPDEAGSMSDVELAGDVDILDVLSTEQTQDLIGAHIATLWPDGGPGLPVHNLSGLGASPAISTTGGLNPGGISYRRLEIVDVQMGSGSETMTVSSVAADTTLIFRANGGADRFIVSAAAASNAMLVILGDAVASANHSGAAGADVIDASAASQGITAYGGAGADTILGGSGPDRIFGGSAADILAGNGGNDLLLGDSGIDFDRLTRITTILTAGAPGLDNLDLAAADTINPGDGFDIVFGDHGRITQSGGIANILSTAVNYILLETTSTARGGNDLISARSAANPAFGTPGAPALAGGDDLIFAGYGADTVESGTGNDVVLGDHGRIALVSGLITRIEATDPNAGDGDTISTDAGTDRVIGGTGSDNINSGADDDIVFGDHGLFDFTQPIARSFFAIFASTTDGGAPDTILAGQGNDIVLGQQGGDQIFGESGDDDLIGGHNIAGGADASDVIDAGTGDDFVAGDNADIYRLATAVSARFITPLPLVSPTQPINPGVYGPTNPAAGFDSTIANPPFLQVANPTIYAEDLSLSAGGNWLLNPRGGTGRSVTLFDTASPNALTLFGNDLIAGGSDNDTLFGGLGNDVIRGDGQVTGVPGSQTLIASSNSALDGDDYIEGNAGDDMIFGDLGQDDLIGGSSRLFGLTTRAQRSDGSDAIFGGIGLVAARNDLGDNSPAGHARDADTILGDNGSIFRLVSTAGVMTFTYDNYMTSIRLVPRAVELLDYTADGNPADDLGAAETLRGEGGDDAIYGMTGDDTLYGDGQDDDLVGGSGNDWLYGGAGTDGILGDDGRIFTARNGFGEALYGIVAERQRQIATPDFLINTTAFVSGQIQKYARLQAHTIGGNDVAFGGLGDDFIHGGGGTDALTGAEAQASFYSIAGIRPTLTFDLNLRRFTAFDPGTGLRRITGFFLNFDASVNAVRIDDGKDTIFGDHGHDWLVGGTNQDRMYGGMGDDVLNADDNLSTSSGMNNIADTGVYAEPDIAFGGGGLDRLIANVTTDRLIDWQDQFNQYLAPFSTTTGQTVTRLFSTTVANTLQALGLAGGADRFIFEPAGELGIITPGDFEWLDQQGRPLGGLMGTNVLYGDPDSSSAPAKFRRQPLYQPTNPIASFDPAP